VMVITVVCRVLKEKNEVYGLKVLRRETRNITALRWLGKNRAITRIISFAQCILVVAIASGKRRAEDLCARDVPESVPFTSRQALEFRSSVVLLRSQLERPDLFSMKSEKREAS
jgi:hypothetical protein